MSIPHLKSGEVVKLALGTELNAARTTTLVKTDDLEVIRLVVPRGKEIPTHKAPGPITVQCLEGRVSFTSQGQSQELDAGKFLYLGNAEPHSLKGIEDSSVAGDDSFRQTEDERTTRCRAGSVRGVVSCQAMHLPIKRNGFPFDSA